MSILLSKCQNSNKYPSKSNILLFKYIFTSLQQTPSEEELWYYGEISYDDAKQLVKNDGDCLVQYSRNQESYVLTVRCGGEVKHFIIIKTFYQVTI